MRSSKQDLIRAVRFFVLGAMQDQGIDASSNTTYYANTTVDLAVKYMLRQYTKQTPGSILGGNCSDFQCWVVPLAADVFYQHFKDIWTTEDKDD